MLVLSTKFGGFVAFVVGIPVTKVVGGGMLEFGYVGGDGDGLVSLKTKRSARLASKLK